MTGRLAAQPSCGWSFCLALGWGLGWGECEQELLVRCWAVPRGLQASAPEGWGLGGHSWLSAGQLPLSPLQPPSQPCPIPFPAGVEAPGSAAVSLLALVTGVKRPGRLTHPGPQAASQQVELS